MNWISEKKKKKVADDGIPEEPLDIKVGRLMGIKLRERQRNQRKDESLNVPMSKMKTAHVHEIARSPARFKILAGLQIRSLPQSTPRKPNTKRDAPKEMQNQSKKRNLSSEKDPNADSIPDGSRTARDKKGPRQEWKFRERRPLPGRNGLGFVLVDEIEAVFLGATQRFP